MLRCVCYWLMYFNRFLYLEEYVLLAVYVTVFATLSSSYALHPTCLLLSLIALIAAFLLLSPRSPWLRWMDQQQRPLTEPPDVARPNTVPSFYMHDEGLLDSAGRRVFLRGVNVSGKLPLGHTTWNQPQCKKGSFIYRGKNTFCINSIPSC